MPRPVVRTFLFSDLRDYTVYVETHGDQAGAKVLRAYRRIMRDEVARHRGAEIKTEGDSFYVVFRTPSAAVRCALGAMRRAAVHGRRHRDLPIELAVGVNTGEAVPHDRGYVGSAVIVAQRLASQAGRGQILVSETVRSLIRTAAVAPLRELGTWTLKGVADPVRVFEVEGGDATAARALGPVLRVPAILREAGATRGQLVCPELIQREAEIGALYEHVSAAALGEARVVALAGEGGIGKSRLCRELARLAYAEGFYVLGGRSFGAADAPYEPFVAALRPYARARGGEVLRRLLGGLVLELRRLLPEVEIREAGREGAIPDEERSDRFFRTIQLLLEDAASLRPLLVVLDDFQHADAASRELLRYLASTLRVGACFVLAYREDELARPHQTRALVAELERQHLLTRLVLGPLDRAGVSRMVEALVPERVAGELTEVLFERSEGIPFYVEELLKTALDAPREGARLAVPRTVRDSVQTRVARLVSERGPSVETLLEAAAVAGLPLAHDILAALSDRDEYETALDLTACVEAQLLERAPTQVDIYRFRHALTREAIADGIAPARRKRLALRVAETLERAVAPAEHGGQLARLFAAGGDTERAVRFSRLGAEHAVSLGAYGTAAELLHEAVANARGTAAEREVQEELALALRAAGQAPEAEAALLRARELARSAEDRDGLARIDVRLADALLMQGRRGEAVTAARRAVAALEGRRGELLAEALCALARLAQIEGDAPEAAKLARRALILARRQRSATVLVSALAVLGAALVRLGDADGVQRLDEAIASGVEHGLHAEVAAAYLDLVRAERSFGHWDAARSAAERGLALARERGLEFAQLRLLTELVVVHYTQGRYREARAVAEQAVAGARPGTTAASTARSLLFLVLTLQGEHDQALALSERIAGEMERAEPDKRMGFFASRARLLLGLARLDEAAVVAREAITFVLASMPLSGVDAFLVASDVAEARRDAAELHALAESFDRHFAGRDAAPIHVVRAEIQAILDDLEGRDPAASFGAVAERYAALGVPVRAAYRRASSAIARLRGGVAPAAARRELATIRTDLIDRGALYYVRIIDRALARVTAARPARVRAERPFTERDLRVALLVSRGATNQRIAEQLGVSAAQASALVAGVLSKLGVPSRAQVASWVLQRQEPVAAR